MPRQIKDLTEKTSPTDTDWLLLQESSGSCKKISRANFVSGLATATATPSAATYQSGMALWLENGELADKSGNSRNATPSGSRYPYKIRAFGGKNSFYFDGANNQQLSVPFFLSGTTAATIYIVYSCNSASYNLVRTKDNDDWYRYFGDGNGYFGALRNARIAGYPASMPNTGDHCISIHSNSSAYEVTLDGVSKGAQPGSYDAGTKFLIGTNGFSYVGAIGLVLVYPSYIAVDGASHASILSAISANYTTLSIPTGYAS